MDLGQTSKWKPWPRRKRKEASLRLLGLERLFSRYLSYFGHQSRPVHGIRNGGRLSTDDVRVQGLAKREPRLASRFGTLVVSEPGTRRSPAWVPISKETSRLTESCNMDEDHTSFGVSKDGTWHRATLLAHLKVLFLHDNVVRAPWIYQGPSYMIYCIHVRSLAAGGNRVKFLPHAGSDSLRVWKERNITHDDRKRRQDQHDAVIEERYIRVEP